MRTFPVGLALGMLVGLGAGFELGTHLVIGLVALTGMAGGGTFFAIRSQRK